VLFYRATRVAFRVVAVPLFRFRVDGVERMPAHGPAVVVAPHRSWLDPACVGGACPRPVRFLVLETVYRLRGASWFFRRMLSVPVRPGEYGSLGALRAALRALEQGEVVGVFPEGRVLGREAGGTIHPGAALLALRAGAPVVPMAIHGSAAAWPHGRRWPGPARVRVSIGEPIATSGVGRPALDELVQRIAQALRELESAGARG
jgi:1-acyl-sn-glycerol-3-phosphate acyltransferase